MIKMLLALSSILLFAAAAFAATPTMRLDYYHTGDASQEIFSLDFVKLRIRRVDHDEETVVGDTAETIALEQRVVEQRKLVQEQHCEHRRQ